MEIRPITVAEYDAAREDIVAFWDSDRTQFMHQTMFLHEFGDSCLAAIEDDTVVGYMVAFASQSERAGYIHLVGVHRDWRGRGVGRALYEHFGTWAAARGCTHLKAITNPANEGSIAFHTALGFRMRGEPIEEGGLPMVRDYGGPGVHRVVFENKLAPAGGPTGASAG